MTVVSTCRPIVRQSLNTGKNLSVLLTQKSRSSLSALILNKFYSTAMDAKALAAGSTCPPQNKRVRIYSMRFCPFAQRPRLVAAYKGIDYEEVNINLKSKPDWFLKKNPLGTVPVVEVDGNIVYESTAAADYIDDLYPEQDRLTPSDPLIRAQDRMLFEYFSKFMSAYQGLSSAKGDAVQGKLEEFKNVVKHYEDALKTRGGPFFGGSKPAIIDFLLWPFFERLPASGELLSLPAISIDKTTQPALAAWESAMLQLPAVKKLLFDSKTHAAFMKTLFSGAPEYDMGL